LRRTAPNSAPRSAQGWWRAAGLALALAYPFAVHYAVLTGRPAPAVALLAGLAGYVLASLLPIGTLARWILPLAASALALAAPGGGDLLLVLPPILIPVLLCWLFGRTLVKGSTPLISRFAELEQGGALTAELARYTRRLTWIWTLLFVALAAISAWLAASGDRVAWSWFTNFASYLLVGALFLGEVVYRRVRYRGYRHDSPVKLASRIRLADLLRRQ
jgi:uncharacterized membrane protein